MRFQFRSTIRSHVIYYVLIGALAAWWLVSIKNYPEQGLWIVYWVAAFLLSVRVPKHPMISILVFIMIAYVTPRYGVQRQILYDLSILPFLCWISLWGIFLSIDPIKTNGLRVNAIVLVFMLFMVWIGLSLVASSRFDLVRHTASLNHGPIQYFYCLVFFMAASQYLNKISTGFWFALCICLGVLVRGGILWLNKDIYLTSDIGMFSAIVFPLGLLLAWHHRSLAVRVVCGLLSVCFPGIILLTQNRTAGVTFISVVTCLFILSSHKLKMIVAGIPCLILLKFVFPVEYWHRFRVIWDKTAEHASANLDLSTMLQRLQLWDVGLEMFKRHFVIGVGPGNFSLFINQFPGQDFNKKLAAHNSIVSIASETGLPGLIFYGLLWASVMGILLKSMYIKDENSVYYKYILASILGCFIAGLFSSRQDFVFVYILFGWVAALTSKKMLVFKEGRLVSEPI